MADEDTPTVNKPPQPVQRRIIRGKAPEIPIFERKNWLIHLHYVRKEFKTCKALIQEQLHETNGRCEFALYVQALIERLEGNIQSSLEIFQKAQQLNSTSPNTMKQVARSLFLLGRHRAALEAYNEAARLSSRDWEIFHNQGICYIHLKDYGQARECLRKAIRLNSAVASFIQLGRVYLLQGEVNMALDLYTHAVNFNPENPDMMSTLGLLYLETGETQKAFNLLGNALTYDPTHFKSILGAGSMIQRQGDYDVALTKYKVATESAPESPQLWNNIGMCFFGKNKYVAAVSCLKRAAYLAPFEWQIAYNLGLVHLVLQQYASAFHFLSTALNLKPRNGQLFMLLAVALTHLDDFENAKQAYEQAIVLEPKNPTIHLNYCIGLYNAGERAAAAKQHSLFERKFASDDSNDVDPEVLATSASIGPSLHVGEGLVWKDGGTENGETERNKKAESNVRKSEAMTDGE
ncbi:Bardet-Biedl syndrome 4 protein-like [Oscarella lobularis]|uniref:Bardet-Biedl syndrome 4 protein-like n=1 Tax=Oscarella lobularis TaxID=121494 RepID=UPI003313956C